MLMLRFRKMGNLTMHLPHSGIVVDPHKNCSTFYDMASYEVKDCPLGALNGEYVKRRTNKTFVHTSSKFELIEIERGIWSIRGIDDKAEYAKARKFNEDPCKVKWEYYSTNNTIWKDSKRMTVIPSGQLKPPAHQEKGIETHQFPTYSSLGNKTGLHCHR